MFDNLTDETTTVTELECGSTYRCKSVQVVSILSLKLSLSYFIFLVCFILILPTQLPWLYSQLSAISKHAQEFIGWSINRVVS